MDMPSTRTQIYLTAEQRRRLDARRKRDRKPLAQLIREAVDAYLADEPDTAAALASTFGSLPDLEVPPHGKRDRG
jgi:predicted DNA-binding protein